MKEGIGSVLPLSLGFDPKKVGKTRYDLSLKQKAQERDNMYY